MYTSKEQNTQNTAHNISPANVAWASSDNICPGLPAVIDVLTPPAPRRRWKTRPLKLVHTSTPDTTKLSCLCRVRLAVWTAHYSTWRCKPFAVQRARWVNRCYVGCRRRCCCCSMPDWPVHLCCSQSVSRRGGVPRRRSSCRGDLAPRCLWLYLWSSLNSASSPPRRPSPPPDSVFSNSVGHSFLSVYLFIYLFSKKDKGPILL